jgi:hypothetical protein
MSTWEIVVVAAVGALVLLALGGAWANARLRRRTAGEFQVSVDAVNRDLAAAHAQDKGWDPAVLADAARRAFEAERPGVTVVEQTLVAVIDRPGVEEDQAVFRVTSDAGETRVTLDRDVSGNWRLLSLE